jgi:integrase
MNRKCGSSRKQNLSQAYKHYTDYFGIPFETPKFIFQRKDPYIPTEELLDVLINGLPFRLSVFCQFLKETASRSGEAWILKRSDIDFRRRLVRITPEKNSNPRTIKISENLINRINRMNTGQYVFHINSHNLKTLIHLFERGRKRLSEKLQDNKIREIHFHTFRHWKATMEYRKTRDILHVKTLLGHKSVNNTLKYIQYAETLETQSDEWTSKIAVDVKEAQDLIESGFEYVTTFESKMLFRKRK